MSKIKYILFLVITVISLTTSAQNKRNANDSTYYDNWVGTWYKVENNKSSSEPTFVVKRGLYHSAFEEYWMGAGGSFSVAWRAWEAAWCTD